MSLPFLIEDQEHAEWISEHATLQEAVAELNRLSTIAWDQPPNQAPCKSWRTCGRRYEILEYNIATTPWQLIARHAGLEIGAKGVFPIPGTDP